MRYIADANGYVKEISFGATIVCDGKGCTEYTGAVPGEYSCLEYWYTAEKEHLYRWKIVGGNLTLDSNATAPETAWEHPPITTGVEYRTTEMYMGSPVYTKRVSCGTASNGAGISAPDGATKIVRHTGYLGGRILPIGDAPGGATDCAYETGWGAGPGVTLWVKGYLSGLAWEKQFWYVKE